MHIHRLLHTMLLIAAIIAAPFLASAGAADEVHPKLRPILRRLDSAMTNRHHFTERRIAIDDSLKTEAEKASNAAEKIAVLEKLTRRYIDFQVDSAIYYAELARDMAYDAGLTSKARSLEANVCGYLTSQGQIAEAMTRFAAIDTTGMTPGDRLSYLTSGTSLYILASYFYPPGPQHDVLTEKGRSYIDQYLRQGSYASDTSRYMAALLATIDHSPILAEASYKNLLEDREETNLYFPLAEQALGFLYLEQGNTDAAIACLSKAFIAELTTGCRSGESAFTLAHELLKRGDTERGRAVLQIAIDNARESGWRIRTLQTAEMSPDVVDKFSRESSAKSIWGVILIVLLLLMTGVAVWCLIKLRGARRQLSELRSRISAADENQRLYFNRFLKLCALYIETLEHFTITARRKIKMKQVDELYKMINSGDVLDEQTKRFYEIFDSAFFHAYPCFVSQLNRLLLPDRQVTTPAPDTLTTELRILAFMRIGFDESAQIAKILSVSVNTIYTYRNRMRSRAISRDTFEDDIMKIGICKS